MWDLGLFWGNLGFLGLIVVLRCVIEDFWGIFGVFGFGVWGFIVGFGFLRLD